MAPLRLMIVTIFFIDTQGWSFAEEAGQPGFKRWMAEFEALNRRLIEALQQQQQQPQQ